MEGFIDRLIEETEEAENELYENYMDQLKERLNEEDELWDEEVVEDDLTSNLESDYNTGDPELDAILATL